MNYFGPKLVMVLSLVLVVSACSTPPRLAAVPYDRHLDSELPANTGLAGQTDVRFYPGDEDDAFVQIAIAAARREAEHLKVAGTELPPAVYLAVSGGGENGAFAAGLLNGWSETGTRPVFKAVTGISTGALVAPFAFLGKSHDGQLKEVFTTVSGKDIFTARGLFEGVFGDAMSDTAPLAALMKKFANRDMLDRIAEEYRRGRLLLIATTDLDAQKPVVWNMGAIAQSQTPEALALFRKILLASAAIPGAFPPVMIDIELDGTMHQEMHVDGGAVSQTFIYPSSVKIKERAKAAGIVRERRLYILRNARLELDWSSVERNTLTIAGRAVASLISSQGVGDLYQIYLKTQRDGVDYNLAFIPPEFEEKAAEPFDNDYMRSLFDFAYQRAREDYPWQKTPPDYAVAN